MIVAITTLTLRVTFRIAANNAHVPPTIRRRGTRTQRESGRQRHLRAVANVYLGRLAASSGWAPPWSCSGWTAGPGSCSPVAPSRPRRDRRGRGGVRRLVGRRHVRGAGDVARQPRPDMGDQPSAPRPTCGQRSPTAQPRAPSALLRPGPLLGRPLHPGPLRSWRPARRVRSSGTRLATRPALSHLGQPDLRAVRRRSPRPRRADAPRCALQEGDEVGAGRDAARGDRAGGGRSRSAARLRTGLRPGRHAASHHARGPDRERGDRRRRVRAHHGRPRWARPRRQHAGGGRARGTRRAARIEPTGRPARPSHRPLALADGGRRSGSRRCGARSASSRSTARTPRLAIPAARLPPLAAVAARAAAARTSTGGSRSPPRSPPAWPPISCCSPAGLTVPERAEIGRWLGRGRGPGDAYTP